MQSTDLKSTQTYCNDTVEDDTIVVPSPCQLSEVFAGLPEGNARVSHSNHVDASKSFMGFAGNARHLRSMVPVKLELNVAETSFQYDGLHLSQKRAKGRQGQE